MEYVTLNELSNMQFFLGKTELRTPKYNEGIFFHMPEDDRRTSTGILYLANCDMHLVLPDSNSHRKFNKNSLVCLPENSKYYSEFVNVENGTPTIYIINTHIYNIATERITVEKDPFLIFENTPIDIIEQLNSAVSKKGVHTLFIADIYLLFKLIFEKTNPGTVEEKNMSQIISYMSNTSKSNKELAEQFNMSVSTLTRMFKKYYKTTPASYALQLKIADAKYRLVYSNISISQISSLLGFNSPEHFSRIFKKHTGLSPTKYRHSNIAKNKADKGGSS